MGYDRHTVGPANKEVPESAIAAQPLAQNPKKKNISLLLNRNNKMEEIAAEF